EQSFQLIWPYTDMLLHDMGPGLADNRPEARANGREWRTPPLWGIGLTERVSGHTYFLHDGRARSLLEAILWHGGGAEQQKQRVVEMPKADRDALIKFLESL
ncbi:MAG: di-heme oxidoredictase family protein, partial [Pseudomonadota bacterium]